MVWTRPVWISGNELCFEIVDLSGDPQDINTESEAVLRDIAKQLQYVTADVNRYNDGLKGHARAAIQRRREEILKKRGFLAAIRVPLRQPEGLPTTFRIPPPPTPKKIAPRPAASQQAFAPEPTLDESDYREILQVIFDFGKVLERTPATYVGKSEEDLRDHILLLLQPRFVGAATGETFNSSGKTDILLRFENTNVFVAELKFWKGAQSVIAAARQLFSYLTWRDSKTALVVLVRNKAFGEVLTSGHAALRGLENFVRELQPVNEAWLDLVFHLPGDSSRTLRTAVLFFHLPAGADEGDA